MDFVLNCMISLLPCEDLVDSCATFGYTQNEILGRYGFTFDVSRTYSHAEYWYSTCLELGIVTMQSLEIQPFR